MTRAAGQVNEHAADDLEELLREPLTDAAKRETETFANNAHGRESRVVLFGAGGLGRRTLAGLRASRLEPLAFSDNRQELWGTSIDGVEVLEPADAARRFGASAVFVVTIWGAGSSHRYEDSVMQLGELGCDCVQPVAWISWCYASTLLPFYALELPSRLLERASEVRRCFELLGDEHSRAEYVEQVRWRLTGDPRRLAHPVPGEQYLVTDIARPDPDDVVLDCGAYDGDTLRSWLGARGPNFAAYFALEPDPGSRERLERFVSSLPPDVAARVHVLPYSVAGHTGTQTFSATGSLSSSIAGDEGIVVDAIRLDDLADELMGYRPTFLKVDIEGAELDALGGANELITTSRPLVAIATYHRQDHLWRVPLAVHDLCGDHRLFLRPHNEQGWDLVLYAVPPYRLPTG